MDRTGEHMHVQPETDVGVRALRGPEALESAPSTRAGDTLLLWVKNLEQCIFGFWLSGTLILVRLCPPLTSVTLAETQPHFLG